MTDPVASLIARLLAERWLPREDHAVRPLLVDADLREDLDRRLAAAGLRLLENPYAAHVAVGIARAQESEVFGGGRGWAASNLALDRDALALLVVIWARLILPKRQRQLARQDGERTQSQTQMFADLKPVPLGADVAEALSERTLLADFGDKLGGKTRIHLNLGVLARQGFIVRRRDAIHEGPLLDLAFDYERIAGRVMDGALAYVVAQARDAAAARQDPDALDADADDHDEDAFADADMLENVVSDDAMPHDATHADAERH